MGQDLLKLEIGKEDKSPNNREEGQETKGPASDDRHNFPQVESEKEGISSRDSSHSPPASPSSPKEVSKPVKREHTAPAPDREAPAKGNTITEKLEPKTLEPYKSHENSCGNREERRVYPDVNYSQFAC